MTCTICCRALCRLALLHESGNRMLMSRLHRERDVSPELLQQLLAMRSQLQQRSPSTWRGQNSGHVYPTIASVLQDEKPILENDPVHRVRIKQFVSAKASSAEAMLGAGELIKPLGDVGMLGEIIFILRPVVYGTTDEPR